MTDSDFFASRFHSILVAKKACQACSKCRNAYRKVLQARLMVKRHRITDDVLSRFESIPHRNFDRRLERLHDCRYSAFIATCHTSFDTPKTSDH